MNILLTAPGIFGNLVFYEESLPIRKRINAVEIRIKPGRGYPKLKGSPIPARRIGNAPVEASLTEIRVGLQSEVIPSE